MMPPLLSLQRPANKTFLKCFSHQVSTKTIVNKQLRLYLSAFKTTTGSYQHRYFILTKLHHCLATHTATAHLETHTGILQLMKTSARDWLITVGTAIILIFLGLTELTIRRDTSANWYLINKAVACTAFLMILLSYSFSAIHHFWRSFRVGIALRRPFGLLGYGVALLHIIITLLVSDPVNPSENKFPFPAYFLDHWISISLALLAVIYFTYAFKISIFTGPFLNSSDRALLWRKRLRYGYVAIILIFVHAAILKYEGWINWFRTFDPSLPPLSLIMLSIGLILIFLKVYHLKNVRRLF